MHDARRVMDLLRGGLVIKTGDARKRDEAKLDVVLGVAGEDGAERPSYSRNQATL